MCLQTTVREAIYTDHKQAIYLIFKHVQIFISAAVNPESVVKVNMDRTAQPGSLSRKCVNDVDLGPMSPINRPSTLLLMDSKRYFNQ